MERNGNSEDETNNNYSNNTADSDHDYLTDVDSDTDEMLSELLTRRDNEESSIASPLCSVISPGSTSFSPNSSSLSSFRFHCLDLHRLCPIAPVNSKKRKGRKEKNIETFIAIENTYKKEMRKKEVK